jgi:uncharacterized membrane protein
MDRRLLCIGIPFGLIGLYLFVLYVLLPSAGYIAMIGLIVAYIVPPAGKETVIPLGVVIGLPWWLMAFTMAFFDVMGALFIIWNFRFALAIPFLGVWIERMMKGGREYFDARPWLERLYYVGLILFVMVPFDGSGGISGAIIGRMMGMKKRLIILCVAIGAFFSTFAIALGSDFIITLLSQDLVMGLIAILILLLFIGVGLVVRHCMQKCWE